VKGGELAIGIDLGTTNTALAYRPLEGDGAARAFPIPQLVRPGEVRARPLLPSFLYLPHEAELPGGAIALPWPDPARPRAVVGELARSLGAATPVRLVSSAKSWLSHPSLDRRAATLPAGAPAEIPRLSPLEASARYLSHLAAAWAEGAAREGLSPDLSRVVLTVPASFDAVARELTVEAAGRAGLEVTLLEEPQAALYAWLEAMGDGWRELLRPGDRVLVVDVGGGTTDFSLIAVADQGGDLTLNRVAVGDHILLGGDNMDLALGHALAEKLERAGHRIDRWQLLGLTHAAREAKEGLFADPSLAELPVSIPGRGSSLVGGALGSVLGRAELDALLLEGFFPRASVSEGPAVPRRTALTTLGLPYASDPAVTRHLAAFLSRHRRALPELPEDASFLHPTAVLFNGGVMKAAPLAARVAEVLSAWLARESAPPPRVLPAADLDLAVAKGAAAYGRVRAGHGIRIRGGTARAYYVGIEASVPAVPGMEAPLRAVCLVPMGLEEGSSVDLPGEEVGLIVGEPVQFRLFASSVRRDDRPGDVVDDDEALAELPPVEATVPPGDRPPGEVVPVRLHAHVTEIGSLELECVAAEGRRHRLEWNLRTEPALGSPPPGDQPEAPAST